MKYCPKCNSRFDDSNSFCLNDGTTLFDYENEQETYVSPSRQKHTIKQESTPQNFSLYLIFAFIGFVVIIGLIALVVWISGQQNPPSVSADSQNSASADNVKLKEKELELRERELELKKKELESKTPEVAQKIPSAVTPVVKPLPPSRANSSGSYSGSVGDSGSTFNLSWNKNKTVTGSFYYDGAQNSVYTVSGSNIPEGQASVNVFDGSQTVGSMKLYKNISGNKICWTGSFYQSSGSTVPVSFCRYR